MSFMNVAEISYNERDPLLLLDLAEDDIIADHDSIKVTIDSWDTFHGAGTLHVGS